MLDLFPFLLFNMLIIFGVHILFSEGMLLSKQGAWITNLVGEYWCKPLICCPPCMASVHGTWFYLAFFGLNWMLVIYVLALCGLTYIVNTLLNK